MALAEQAIRQVGNNTDSFFEKIGRVDLKGIVTTSSPWVIHTSEIYLDGDGFRGNGGLGILDGDKIRLAEKLGIPLRTFSLMYASRSHQVLEAFWQKEEYEAITPEQIGFQRIGSTSIGVNSHRVDLDQYLASQRAIYGSFEPGLGAVYAGKGDSEHRLYQYAVAGFSNYQLRKELGIKGSVEQLEEVSTALTPLAEFDDLCGQGLTEDEAIVKLREKYILTNHTLVPAAIPVYSRWQYEQYVFSNMRSETAKSWLSNLIDHNGGYMSLSLLAHTFAGRFNGVSVLHAEVASGQFTRADNEGVDFYPITNGIDIERWTHPSFYSLYQQEGIVDKFDLPTQDHEKRIDSLDPVQLREIKREASRQLHSYLATRQDQYGQVVVIPEDAKIACWSKRVADYKRPEMLFQDVGELRRILEEGDIHIILSGKVHPEDQKMKTKLQQTLQVIDQDPILKSRIHFIQDYDEDLATPLVAGVDIWFNTPQVGKEACGTSWMKALSNLAVLISTEDGGVADIRGAHYLKIEGDNALDEVNSLYENFKQAVKIVNGNDDEWAGIVKDQLSAYLYTISGSRMWRDYLEFVFPRSNVAKEEILSVDA